MFLSRKCDIFEINPPSDSGLSGFLADNRQLRRRPTMRWRSDDGEAPPTTFLSVHIPASSLTTVMTLLLRILLIFGLVAQQLILSVSSFLHNVSPTVRSVALQRQYQAQTSLCMATELSKEEIARYSRHLVLGDVGMEGQKALKNASVLVVGAGGLGSPCLLYLAAAGVGHVGIVDGDTVDESNLQRQIIHGTSTVGMSKCESALERIKDVNPNVNVRPYKEEFTSDTAMRILGDGFEKGRPYDIVVDGSDNFPTKYLINDAVS